MSDPKKKQDTREQVQFDGFYLDRNALEQSRAEVLSWINLTFDKAEAQGYTDVRFQFGRGWEDTDDLAIYGTRLETDHEVKARLIQAEHRMEREKNRIGTLERELKTLKKKYPDHT